MTNGRKSARLDRAVRRAAREEGIAIVFSLVLLTIGLAVGAAALAETLAGRSHANRDTRALRALQAADFGVQAALYRENQLNVDSLDLTGGVGVLGKLADCVIPKLNKEFKIEGTVTVSVASSGVSSEASTSACPVGEVETPTGPKKAEYIPVGNHDSYTAEFVPGEKVLKGSNSVTFAPKIISIGKDENNNPSDSNHVVYARVEANLASVDPLKTVEAIHNLKFGVPGTAKILPGATLFNGTARAGNDVEFAAPEAAETGSTFTAGNILGSGGSIIAPSEIDYGCQPRYELNKLKLPKVTLVNGASLLKHVESPGAGCEQSYFSRQAISISGSKPDCSSTCAGLTGYVAGRNGKGEADSTKSNQDEIYNTNSLVPVELTAGTDYVFCSFYTTGPVTIKGATSSSLPVRVFIDSPSTSRCKEFVPHDGIKAAGNFTATQGVGGGGTSLSPTQMQIYLVGNGTNEGTSFTSGGATTLASGFVLYAPQSNVTVKGLSFTGLLLGYNVNAETTLFSQDIGLNNYPLSSAAGVFRVTGYTQCSLNNSAGKAVTQLSTTSAAADASGC